MDSWGVTSCENLLMPWTKGQRGNSLLWLLIRVQALVKGNTSHGRSGNFFNFLRMKVFIA